MNSFVTTWAEEAPENWLLNSASSEPVIKTGVSFSLFQVTLNFDLNSSFLIWRAKFIGVLFSGLSGCENLGLSFLFTFWVWGDSPIISINSTSIKLNNCHFLKEKAIIMQVLHVWNNYVESLMWKEKTYSITIQKY